MQTSKEEPKTKKSKAKASKAAPSNPNPDVQESPQAASNPGTAEQQPAPAVQLLDLNKIVNSTYNPRKDFRPETLQELADSIRQVGVLQPICVRPKEGGFEIVYGERRYWAAAMAGLKFIPALVRELSDAEAEDAAITENLQREDVTPREEAAAYKRALESGRHTIESLVGKFGKSEAYIRSRLKICDLIDALAEQLDREEISVGVATEIAKYDAEVQQEVYEEHFSDGCRLSWKNARIREIARRLYDRYMTRLDTYRFDKAECHTCHHNTANQILFKDECAEGCAGCQNRSCMMRKNDEYLVQQALQLQEADPRIVLATVGDTPDSVIEHLEEEGYRIQELDYYLDYYDTAPEMPEAPQAECYSSEGNYAEAVKRYEAALARFTEQTRQLEFDVTEGRVRKYAVIGMFDVEIRYEDVPEEEREVAVEDAAGERTVYVTMVPASPMESLLRQDHRNRQLCYEHITADMKTLFRESKVSDSPLTEEEHQMFYYAVIRHMADDRLQQCGIEPQNQWRVTEEERFAAAGQLTPEQRAAMIRLFLLDFFRTTARDYNCTDEEVDTRLMCRFADLNFEAQSRILQEKYLATYERRRTKLQEQIDDLKAQEEARALAESRESDAESIPEELPEEPEATPDTEIPAPPAEPLIIPADPEFGPNETTESLAA
jgi:ParB family chromosome partitioning protein